MNNSAETAAEEYRMQFEDKQTGWFVEAAFLAGHAYATRWIKVTPETLPELTEPFIGYNDEGVQEVFWENDHANIIAYSPSKGVVKARYDRRGTFAEVSNNSICGLNDVTHYRYLDTTPPAE